MNPEQAPFVLPAELVTRTDFLQLINELERVDNELTTASARSKAGVTQQEAVVLSPVAQDFINVNQLSLDASATRSQLITQLRALKDKLPITHLTFATAADHASLTKRVTWLRQSVHPMSLITVGLQPDLISGVHVRTPNRVYDLSVRQKLADGRHLLVEAVEAVSAGR